MQIVYWKEYFAVVGALCFIFLNAQQQQILVPPTDQYSFAVISDLHIGLGELQTTLLQDAVNSINAQVALHNIKFVVITGDITNNALAEQYQEAKDLLSKLTVPFLPIFGNHDAWTYSRPTSWSSPEEATPTGDLQFKYFFEDIFKNWSIYHHFETYVDPKLGYNVTYLNWMITINSNSTDGKDLVLFGLDYVTRNKATNPRDFCKGVGPTADLHNWENGTFVWLQRQLAVLNSEEIGHVVFMHHHPYMAMPFWVPDYFSMNHDDRENVKQLLSKAPLNLTQFWGAIVGHMHFWDDASAMFPSFRQWENTATMNEGVNSISIVQINRGYVENINRCCGWWTKSSQVVLRFTATAAAAFFQVLAIFLMAKYVKQEGKRETKIRNANFPSFTSADEAQGLLDHEDPLLSGGLGPFPVNDTDTTTEPSTCAALKEWFLLVGHDQRLGPQRGFIWFIAVISTFISLGMCAAGPQIYSETYQAITVGLYNDASLMPFALLISFGLAFPFGSYFAHYFGYIVYLIIWALSFIVDFIRYDIRTFWENAETSYIEFYGPGISLGLLILLTLVYYMFLRRPPSERPIGVHSSFSIKLFLRFLVLLTLPGLSLQVFLSTAPAVSHRLLMPINWPPFDAFFYTRVIVCCAMFLVYPVTCYLALRHIHPLFVITGSYSFFTVINVCQELLLRVPTFKFPLAISLVWWGGANLLLVSVGIVAWANFKIKVREARAQIGKRRINDY